MTATVYAVVMDFRLTIRCAQNSPLFIKTFVPDTGLKFHYIVHSSLDVIEERVGKKMLVTGDKYLGLLYPTEEFKVYGYVTMTRVKFILALDDNANPKDADVKQFCTKFHGLYVDAISNPFYTLDDKIDSKKFEKEVSALVAAGL